MCKELSEALDRRCRQWGERNKHALAQMRIEMKNPSRFAYLAWKFARKRQSLYSGYYTKIGEAE